jgi:phage tail-like protein
MGPGNSALIKWATKGLRQQDFVPLNVFIKLLNGKADNEGNIIKTWSFYGAWPIKLVVSDFKATDNTVVVESLELAYQYFDSDGTTGAAT